MRRVGAGVAIAGHNVEREAEAVDPGLVCGDDALALDGDDMVALEHDRKGWLDLAVLEAEDELGHDGQLIHDRIRVPVRDLVHSDVVIWVETAVVELHARRGAEPKSVSDPPHERGDPCHRRASARNQSRQWELHSPWSLRIDAGFLVRGQVN
jgi:hypothetical protein